MIRVNNLWYFLNGPRPFFLVLFSATLYTVFFIGACAGPANLSVDRADRSTLNP